jgi:hypothetical protein
MANATNQKKGIVTRGSGHIAESSGASLPYFEKGKAGPTVTDDNHIETSKCSVKEAAQRTFIEAHNVIHHQSKIGVPHGGGPSTYDRQHGFAQKNPAAYQWFACSQENSPDTMVEGKWVVRTNDKTMQDGGNGPGKFSPGAGRVELLDEQELLFHQCAVDNIKLECRHGRETMGRELHVLIGDTVKVTAFRVNATETDPEKRLDVTCWITRYKERRKPPAEETKHAAFVLNRNGRLLDLSRRWDEIKNKTMVGTSGKLAVPGSKAMAEVSVLELKEDWLLKVDEKADEEAAGLGVGPLGNEYDDYDAHQDGNAAGHDHYPAARREQLERDIRRKERRVERAKAEPGRPGRASGKPGQMQRDLRNAEANLPKSDAAEAQRQKTYDENKKKADAINANARLVVDSYKIVMDFFVFQPLTINIEAHGCSPGAMAVIKAYPPEQLKAELIALKDFPGKKTIEITKSYVTAFSDFFKAIKGANLVEYGPDAQLGKRGARNIEVFFLRNKEGEYDVDPSLELDVQWKELERDSNPAAWEAAGRKAWQVHRSWGLNAKIGRLLGLMINFEVDLNYCLGIGRFIADLLSFLGVKTGVFLTIDINLSVGVQGKLTVNEYGKWGADPPSIPALSVIKLSIVAKVGRFFQLAFRVMGRWEPEFKFTRNKRGQVVLKREASKYVITMFVQATVDILGWDLDAYYDIAKWPFEIKETEFALFGGGP